MSITKAKISKVVSKRTNISSREGHEITNYFLKLIIENSKYKTVKISGFGNFYRHLSPKRLGRNPKTKESYIINAMNKTVFKVSNKIKNILN